MKIKDYFDISYGQRIYHSKKHIENKKGIVPLISSKGKDRGIHGYYDIEPKYKNIITAPSTGTVCHAFYQKEECCVDDNTLVFLPKIDLSEREMIFYSLYIRKFKDFFMYGRQVTPERIGNQNILERSEIPSWVYEIEIPDYSDIAEPQEAREVLLPDISLWGEFKFSDIFHMEKGKGGTQQVCKRHPGNNPYISATEKNNGLVFRTSLDCQHTGNVITVSDFGEAFFQEKPFLGSHIVVLKPKTNIQKECFLFLITMITKNKDKYNFGRSFSLNKIQTETITLPCDTSGNPNWQLMGDYIKSLPYSQYL